MYHSKFRGGPVCVALLLIHSASQAQLSFNLTTVATPGEAVPVPPELVAAYGPTLNDSGQVAFMGDGALLLRSNGVTTIAAAFGDPVLGGGTFVYGGGPLLNSSGQIAFWALLAGPDRSGILLWSEGGLQIVVQDGDPAPGGGALFLTYEYSLNSLGDVVFGAYTSLGDHLLFLFSQGSLSLLARQGDPAPRGGTFRRFHHPVININRQVAFGCDLEPSGYGIFLRSADGSMTEVVREGDPAPGGEPLESSVDGAATLYPGSAEINDAGAVAFSATASIYGRGGIFLFSNGQIMPQIRENDPAPGGGVFSYFSNFSLNSAGQIAFQASDTSTNGVFLFSGGAITEVVRTGERSPEGDRFVYFAYSTVSLSAVGQVTFESELENSLGGIYLFSNGDRTRIAGQGDPIDREPKLVSARPEAIDDSGTIAFRGLSFPGEEELFVGDLSAPIVRLGESTLQGGAFDYFYVLAMNGSGQSIFQASSSLFSGIYSRSGEVLNRIVGTGDPAPGGGRFADIRQASINNAGDIAFVGNGFFSRSPAVFVLSGGEFHQLVGRGDPAPGGGTFRGFSSLSINDAGQVAFTGNVSPPTRWGVFLWSNGNTLSIAQTGDPAPGGGTFVIPGGTIPAPYAPSVNAAGEIVFGAQLSSPNGPTGVFLFSAGGLSRIAGSGDPAPGGGIFVSPQFASLNDLGEVSFATSLNSSGFGIYLASQGTINKVVASGDPAPSGDTFSRLDVTKLNSRGQVAFQGSTSVTDDAIYLATPIR